MITENLSTLKIHKLTQAQYDRELAAGRIDETALYLTPDEEVDLSGYATIDQLNAKADSTHNHDGSYYKKTEVDTKLSTKANTTHNHDKDYDEIGAADKALEDANAYTDALGEGFAQALFDMYGDDITDDGAPTIREIANNEASSALSSAKTYTDGKIDALVGDGASETLDTIGEISAAIEENQDIIDTLNAAIGNKVDKVSGKGLSTNDLTSTLKSNYDTAYSHVSNKSNPHGVTLSQLGVNATAAELNHVDGVTSNIQTQLNAKVPTSRTINGKTLSSNITLSASDLSAYTKTEIDNMELITVADIDAICSATTNIAIVSLDEGVF